MLILVGSAALKWHGIDTNRTSFDVDVVGSYDDIVSYGKSLGKVTACYPFDNGNKVVVKTINGIVEGEITWEGSSAEDLWNTVRNDLGTSYEKRPNGFIIPSLDFLYTLKMSHRYRKNSPHFLKTMRDIQLMRQHEAKIPDHLQEFYERRMKATYTYAHPKLNQSKKDFFSDDGIKYVYPHDDIHKIVKRLDKPAYEYFKPEDSQVMVSKAMWDNLDEHTKLCAVVEEATVLALERSQIPFPGLLTPKQSFDIALMKVATSITSGWFREYSWESYDKVMEMFDPNYVTRFWEAVEKGEIKPL